MHQGQSYSYQQPHDDCHQVVLRLFRQYVSCYTCVIWLHEGALHMYSRTDYGSTIGKGSFSLMLHLLQHRARVMLITLLARVTTIPHAFKSRVCASPLSMTAPCLCRHRTDPVHIHYTSLMRQSALRLYVLLCHRLCGL